MTNNIHSTRNNGRIYYSCMQSAARSDSKVRFAPRPNAKSHIQKKITNDTLQLCSQINWRKPFFFHHPYILMCSRIYCESLVHWIDQRYLFHFWFRRCRHVQFEWFYFHERELELLGILSGPRPRSASVSFHVSTARRRGLNWMMPLPSVCVHSVCISVRSLVAPRPKQAPVMWSDANQFTHSWPHEISSPPPSSKAWSLANYTQPVLLITTKLSDSAGNFVCSCFNLMTASIWITWRGGSSDFRTYWLTWTE
jgi:hypothetical protein